MLTPEQLADIRKRCEGNAEFCPSARTDIPALFAYIDELEKANLDIALANMCPHGALTYRDCRYCNPDALAAQVAELRAALEAAADVLEDIGVGGMMVHRNALDDPLQRAQAALRTVYEALARDPGDTRTKVDAGR